MNVTYDKSEFFGDPCLTGGFAGGDLRFKNIKNRENQNKRAASLYSPFTVTTIP